MILERVGERMSNLWGYLFGDGPEDEVQELEDERLRDSRERRRQARMLLAERKEEDAARSRALAEAAGDPDVADALRSDAEEDERTARKLRRGQVGLLNAMGIPTDDILSEAAGRTRGWEGGRDGEG